MSVKDGKYNLKLGDKNLELKGDWKCISAIEDNLGQGILPFYLNDLANMSVTVSQIGMIYKAGLNSCNDTRLNLDDICELIAKDGIMEHVKPCIEFVTMMVNGGNLDKATSEKK